MTDIVERLGILVEGAGLPWRADLCDIVRDDPNDDDPMTVAHCGCGEGIEETIVTVMNAAPVMLDTITTLRAEVAALREGLAIMEPVLRERASLARTARTIAGFDGLTTADKKAIVAHQIARAFFETKT